MMNKHCGECKYFAEVITDKKVGNEFLHRCNNDKSIFKACLSVATGCNKFEKNE